MESRVSGFQNYFPLQIILSINVNLTGIIRIIIRLKTYKQTVLSNWNWRSGFQRNYFDLLLVNISTPYALRLKIFKGGTRT